MDSFGSHDPAARLRRLRAGDAQAVLDAFASHPDMLRQGTVETLPQAQAYVSRLLDPQGPHRAWAIVDATNALLGLVCVSVDQQNRNGWFWYWMHASARGRGLASRAAAAVAQWALADGGLERLELGHRVDNPASGGVARAAGFIQEGREREKFLIDGKRVDVLTYSRLRSDPVPAAGLLPMLDPDALAQASSGP